MTRNLLSDFARPLLFAHRGYSSRAPENTLAAFTLARKLGIPGIELDVRLCSSGELIVFHDGDLKRVTGVTGPIAEKSLDELRELEAGSHFDQAFNGEAIPLLSEVFEAIGPDMYVDIEIKTQNIRDTAIVADVLKSIDAHGMRNRCFISSFSPFVVREARKTGGGLATSLIYSASLEKEQPLRSKAAKIIASTPVLKPQWILVEKTIKKALRRNTPIITWTVNDKETAARCLEAGVEGIISDDPQIVQSLL
ncbi:MAG: glycerophosphodiester phosphodiesterase [Spirochaetales bacterium]|jgi:glycerophosphoryl diester phosphodiesterase|nr:glycerophosphodiester phosphodiesterase [Spirochaetales bacterium]